MSDTPSHQQIAQHFKICLHQDALLGHSHKHIHVGPGILLETQLPESIDPFNYILASPLKQPMIGIARDPLAGIVGEGLARGRSNVFWKALQAHSLVVRNRYGVAFRQFSWDRKREYSSSLKPAMTMARSFLLASRTGKV